MTERTFRSPSPGGRGNGAVSPAVNAPPVPMIPQSIYTRQHQRSSSMEPQQRVISPTPGRGERASSMDRRTGPPSAARRGGKRLSNVNEELDGTNNNSGVNFSRPRTSQPSSPVSPTTDKQYTHGPGNWFSEPIPEATPSRQPAQKSALESKIDRIQAAAGQPVKRDDTVNTAQGTYLHQAAQQVELERPTASRSGSYETSDAIMEYDPASRTFISRPRPQPKVAPPPAPVPAQQLPQIPKLRPGQYDPHTRSIVPYPEQKTLAPALNQRASSMTVLSQKSRPIIDTNVAPPPRNPARLSPISSPSAKGLHKQPSVVHERPYEEEIQASPSTGKYITTSAGPVKAYVAPTTRQQRSSSLDIPRGSYDGSTRGRGSSTSPSRHTHFSAKPVVQGTIHNPPPRDVSPIKSALKHSPVSSVRTSSPLANFSPGPRSPSSETSDTTSQTSQDAFSGRKKKKSVRVSFDEQPQVVETVTSASIRAPLDDSEDDELMKPRPALPSFGSVRNQRNPAIAEKVTETPPERHESSSDHAVGGILRNAHEATLPIASDITSKDAADSISDDSDSDLGAPLATSTPAQPQVVGSTKDEPTSEAPVIRDFAAVPDSNVDLDVPAINLLPPTPGAEEEHKTLSPDSSPKHKQSFEINMPGSWRTSGSHEAEIAFTVDAQSQGPVIPDDPIIYESPMEHSLLLSPIDESEDDFSDAPEDQSEFDNGGFASLDAIAVSPIINATSTNGTAGTTSPPESPTANRTTKSGERGDVEDRRSDGDWSQATAYWSKLSRQQREAIEREHMSSDDESRPSVPIARKKKTTAPKPAPSATYEDDESPRAALKPALKPAMRKSMRTEPEPEPVAARPASPEITMRKSMRSSGSVNAGNGTSTARTGGMASTLRNGPPAPKQRQSTTQPAGGFANKSMRPTSSGSQASVALGASSAGAAMVKQRQQQSAPAQDSSYPLLKTKPAANGTPAVSAKLQKDLANDSDSESSFKKQRKQRSASTNTTGRYSMAKSMRGGDVASPAPARPVSPEPVRGKGKDSFSIRSLSPAGSFFGRKKRTEEVKQSIRGSTTDSGSRMSMRNQPPARTMRPQSTQQSKPTTSRFKSRFADSDDEDDDDKPSSSFFKSRFATESDDEDDDVFIPATLRPVRGIPRKQGQTDGDSTDLEDEEDNSRTSSRGREKMAAPIVPASADIDAAMEIARKKLGITSAPTEPAAGNQGGALQQGSLRTSAPQPEPKSKPEEVDTTPRKRGWSLLRRNRNSASSVTQVTARPTSDVPPVPPVLPSPTLAGPIAPALDTTEQPSTPMSRPQSPTVSPAGRLIRRSSAQQAPRFKRGDSTYSNATAPPAVGESTVNGGWPLPPVPNVPDKFADRPFTSDGGPQVRFDDSSDVGMNSAAEGRGGVYSARTGKKKKFGLLRKAFGLAD